MVSITGYSTEYEEYAIVSVDNKEYEFRSIDINDLYESLMLAINFVNNNFGQLPDDYSIKIITDGADDGGGEYEEDDEIESENSFSMTVKQIKAETTEIETTNRIPPYQLYYNKYVELGGQLSIDQYIPHIKLFLSLFPDVYTNDSMRTNITREELEIIWNNYIRGANIIREDNFIFNSVNQVHILT